MLALKNVYCEDCNGINTGKGINIEMKAEVKNKGHQMFCYFNVAILSTTFSITLLFFFLCFLFELPATL